MAIETDGQASNDRVAKQRLLRAWVDQHCAGRLVRLLGSGPPDFVLADEAAELLAAHSDDGPYIYLMFDGDPRAGGRPRYIGKAASAHSRWTRGHLPAMRKAARGSGGRLYNTWVQAIGDRSRSIHLLCVAESEIARAPIPGFPSTVGAVEYQLVSLAADAYPGRLLNDEGVAR